MLLRTTRPTGTTTDSAHGVSGTAQLDDTGRHTSVVSASRRRLDVAVTTWDELSTELGCESGSWSICYLNQGSVTYEIEITADITYPDEIRVCADYITLKISSTTGAVLDGDGGNHFINSGWCGSHATFEATGLTFQNGYRVDVRILGRCKFLRTNRKTSLSMRTAWRLIALPVFYHFYYYRLYFP